MTRWCTLKGSNTLMVMLVSSMASSSRPRLSRLCSAVLVISPVQSTKLFRQVQSPPPRSSRPTVVTITTITTYTRSPLTVQELAGVPAPQPSTLASRDLSTTSSRNKAGSWSHEYTGTESVVTCVNHLPHGASTGAHLASPEILSPSRPTAPCRRLGSTGPAHTSPRSPPRAPPRNTATAYIQVLPSTLTRAGNNAKVS